MKFCANISFMFTEAPFVERYHLAKEAGFKAIESGFSVKIPVKEVTKAQKSSGIQQILINTYTGDFAKGEWGYTALPGKEEEFKDTFQTTINYAKAVGAKKIHIMAGKVDDTVTEAHDRTFVENLKYASKILETENILGVIEPINKYLLPGYYLNYFDTALSAVQKVDSPNLKIMLDIFHLQFIQGNVTNTIKDLIQFIGHVQIAQVPNRHEPDFEGELNYSYVLKTLEKARYNDWIGLEYIPAGDVKEGLKWVEKYGYSL